MFIIGIILFIVIVALLILLGSTIGMFLDAPSLLFVIFGYVAVLVATNAVGDFMYGLSVINSKPSEIDFKKLGKAVNAFDLLQKASFGIGGIGFVIGFISMLTRLEDPSTIGPSIAVALLVVFYCIIINVIFLLPGKYILYKVESREIEE